jgi:hypothetical protein
LITFGATSLGSTTIPGLVSAAPCTVDVP